jgi:AraC-like DNA-binding protein
VYIPPGIPHAIDQRAADVAIFFLAPESDLQHHVVAHYGLPAARLSLDPAFPDGWAARSWAPSMTAADIHDEIVRLLAPGFVTRTESADERVAAVAERIRRESALNHPAANLAAMVHLSPSRLSALFTANVGMPMRRYRIWQRLRSAAAAIAEGYSYSDAAAMSGFADAAHFSSSTRHLFGVAPSDVLGSRPADTIRL